MTNPPIPSGAVERLAALRLAAKVAARTLRELANEELRYPQSALKAAEELESALGAVTLGDAGPAAAPEPMHYWIPGRHQVGTYECGVTISQSGYNTTELLLVTCGDCLRSVNEFMRRGPFALTRVRGDRELWRERPGGEKPTQLYEMICDPASDHEHPSGTCFALVGRLSAPPADERSADSAMTDASPSPLAPDAPKSTGLLFEARSLANYVLGGPMYRQPTCARMATLLIQLADRCEQADAGLARLLAERDGLQAALNMKPEQGALAHAMELAIAQREAARLRAAEGALTDEQVDTFIITLCDLIAERVGEPPIIGYTPGEVRAALRAALAQEGK